MNATLAYFIGTLVGVIVTIVVTRPLQAWKEGYDTAKEHYSDWEKGFNDGWKYGFSTGKNCKRMEQQEGEG